MPFVVYWSSTASGYNTMSYCKDYDAFHSILGEVCHQYTYNVYDLIAIAKKFTQTE